MNLQFLDMVIAIIWIEGADYPCPIWFAWIRLFPIIEIFPDIFKFAADWLQSINSDTRQTTLQDDQEFNKKYSTWKFSLQWMYFQVQNETEINLLLGEYDSVQKQVGKSNKTIRQQEWSQWEKLQAVPSM